MSTRRADLTREAARLFAERGFHGTSMGDLAEALGVQKGSLYSLTGSKQELLFQTMQEGARAFHDALDAVPEDATAIERVRLALRGHLRVVSQQLDVATVFTREWRYLEEAYREQILDERRRYEDRWRALFREGVESGGLRRVSEGAARRWSVSRARTGRNRGWSQSATPTSSRIGSPQSWSTGSAATRPRPDATTRRWPPS